MWMYWPRLHWFIGCPDLSHPSLMNENAYRIFILIGEGIDLHGDSNADGSD